MEHECYDLIFSLSISSIYHEMFRARIIEIHRNWKTVLNSSSRYAQLKSSWLTIRQPSDTVIAASHRDTPAWRQYNSIWFHWQNGATNEHCTFFSSVVATAHPVLFVHVFAVYIPMVCVITIGFRFKFLMNTEMIDAEVLKNGSLKLRREKEAQNYPN